MRLLHHIFTRVLQFQHASFASLRATDSTSLGVSGTGKNVSVLLGRQRVPQLKLSHVDKSPKDSAKKQPILLPPKQRQGSLKKHETYKV